MEVRGATLSQVQGAPRAIDRPVIEVRDLYKRFVVKNAAIGSLKTLALWWKRRSVQQVEVLKGISFDLMPAECMAVIGRNGAGKSTLLSLIAKIYKPTSGTIAVRGRIAPLLQLGAGFHPDLTGLENIEYNAAILGLNKRQRRERLDEIVEFSELGPHINAPVRMYSSGMVARLGFSIATHVDADILIVDEVLSVGDFEFTQKCMDRLADFKSQGGSILLVSHSTETVENFADRAIWIQHGLIQMAGTPADVIPAYRAGSESDLTG